MSNKVIDLKTWLKKKYKETSREDEDLKLALYDRCKKQEIWAKKITK